MQNAITLRPDYQSSTLPQLLPDLKGLTPVKIICIFDPSEKRKIFNNKKYPHTMEKVKDHAPEVPGTKVEATKEEVKISNKKAKRIAAKKAARIAEKKKLAAEAEAEALKPKEEAKPEKKKKTDKETLKDQTAAAVAIKITEEKELKYIYPPECSEGTSKYDVLEKRKKFRAGVRRKIASFENQVKKIADEMIVLEADPIKNKKALRSKKKAMEELEETYVTYAREVYVRGEEELQTV